MKRKIHALALVALACLLSTGCGMKVMAKGHVVDTVTGQPIEGAAVAIKWVNEKFAPPGLGSNDEDIGTTETLTDSKGYFTIPRYLNRTPFMGIYKKGYVCWSSEIKFNPHGKINAEVFQKRSYPIRDGMVIQLQSMPNDISFEQRKLHACFTIDVRTRLTTIAPTSGERYFFEAVRKEDKLCRSLKKK